MNNVREISFRVSTREHQVEFTGRSLSQDEATTAMNVFSSSIGAAYMDDQNDIVERMKTFFPSEKEEQEEDHPDNANYLDTGIKYKKVANGWMPTYRTRYQCTNKTCNNQGNRYVEEKAKTTKCHNCSERMELREATEIGFPNRDSYGNFFLAGDVVN
jgi:hypothetical protein